MSFVRDPLLGLFVLIRRWVGVCGTRWRADERTITLPLTVNRPFALTGAHVCLNSQIQSGTVMEGRIAACHELTEHVAPSIHRASQEVLEEAERALSHNKGKPPSTSRNVLFGGY